MSLGVIFAVLQRNAISGLLEHKDLVHSPDRHLGQNLYSPAGKVYQYIMDGSFQNQVVEVSDVHLKTFSISSSKIP